jgi:transcriptional regulator with PAS, ATPase and Fis domain
MAEMLQYDWPGNVRELENAVEYGTNMTFGKTIGIDEVPARMLKKEDDVLEIRNLDKTLSEQLKLYEKEIIIQKLKQHNGTKEVVAKELGLSRATLYRKLSELDIN